MPTGAALGGAIAPDGAGRFWLSLISVLSVPERRTILSASISATFQPPMESPTEILAATGLAAARTVAMRFELSMMMPKSEIAGGDALEPEDKAKSVVVSAATGARARSNIGRALIWSKLSPDGARKLGSGEVATGRATVVPAGSWIFGRGAPAWYPIATNKRKQSEARSI
jgi:hypothetical protein